jgi:hypothetical protein
LPPFALALGSGDSVGVDPLHPIKTKAHTVSNANAAQVLVRLEMVKVAFTSRYLVYSGDQDGTPSAIDVVPSLLMSITLLRTMALDRIPRLLILRL